MRALMGERGLIIISFFIIYFVWGSTYLANIIVIEVVPPFLMVCSRLLSAGAILLLLVKILGQWEKPTRQEWKNVVIASLLFLGIGLSGVVWAEQYIDSGVTALIVALEPLIVVLAMWLTSQEIPKRNSVAGVFLGIIGSYILVNQQEVVASWEDWKGILAIFVAITSWAFGAVFISKNKLPKSLLTTAALQMLISGALLLPVIFINGDVQNFDWHTIHSKTIYAWLFLVLFGSVTAYTAFNYLLKKVSPDKVSTSTYIHPIVALFLGWFFRDEIITRPMLLAMMIMLTGVLFINTNFNNFKKKKKIAIKENG